MNAAGDPMMSDDELITSVRESFTGVRSATLVEQIESRSRAIRARRRIPRVAAVLAVAAGTAAAGAALAPSGHLAASQLAAWTVVKQADGAVQITVRELRNPAGLQRTLRADGIPASVTFTAHENPACHAYPGPYPDGDLFGRPTTTMITFHPSALPPGTGVQIGVSFTQPPYGGAWGLGSTLVQISPQCTGS